MTTRLILEKQQRSDVDLSERLASLATKGAQLRVTLNPLDHRNSSVLRGLRGALNLATTMMKSRR